MNKKRILYLVLIIGLIGLLFGSIYLSVLDNSNKKTVLNTVNNYFYTYKDISFSNKLSIFKDTFIKNTLFYLFIWVIGLSIIGLPIIFFVVFIKFFVTGFSISSIFSLYKFKGILGIIIYMFPSNIINLLYLILISSYSVNLSIKLFIHVFKKKSFNFNNYMNKYILILLISILLSFIISLYEAFINPYFYKLFTNIIK